MSAVTVATVIVTAAQVYLATGAVFAIAFALFLAARIDPGAKHSSWGFKLLIFPSATLLWPLLLRRVLRHQSPPVECSAHRARAKARPLDTMPEQNPR